MTTDARSDNGNLDEAIRFIIKLGEAAHGYGSTAARLEGFLSRLTEALGFSSVVRSTPTEIYFAFQEAEGGPQRTHLSALPGTGLDLNKLGHVGELVDAVEAGQVSVSQATARLDEIGAISPPWGVVASAASYAFVGSGVVVLWACSWWDVAVSAILSLVVYAMVLLAGRFGARTAEWLPLSSAFVAAAAVAATKIWVPELNLALVTLAAIVVLIPGYSISLGVIEIVGRHIVSGSANLTSGLVYLAKQFAGAWLGVGLAGSLFVIPTAAAGAPVDARWLWLFMPLLIGGLCVVFQTSRRDLLAASFGCVIAYGGILLGSAMVGGNLGNLIGTVVAVVFANLWAARTRRPTSIVLLPAIILLVSGSIGFRGLAAIAAGQAAVGQQQFLQMFVVALTIAAGLLVGNTIVRPKASL